MAEENGAPQAVRLAGLIAAVEGAAVLLATAVLAVTTVMDRPDSYGRAVFAVVIGVVAGLLLLRIGRGLARAEGWTRAPVVVAQALLVPIGYTLAVSAEQPLYGVPIMVLCLAEISLLLTPAARLAFMNR